MWVRGHSRSLKVVPFESRGTVFYSPSVVTMAVSLAISEIFSVKKWSDLEIWVSGTIRYDSVCLTCSKKLTGSQLSLPHGTNKKLKKCNKCKTKNKMMSVIGPVQSRYRETVQ